ncbi:MAG: trypsin-like peptidase domain-containing protein [Pirellulales bacterium]|nr:trypsin-like peptidase domain-containing protein [Pirellulales bacterium]
MGLRYLWGARRRAAMAIVVLLCFVVASSVRAEPRMWRDPAGKFRFKAELIELGDGFVRLKKTDGSVVRLTLDELSTSDRVYLAKNADAVDTPPPTNTPRRSDKAAPQESPSPAPVTASVPPPAPTSSQPVQALPELVERVEQSVVRIYGKLKDGLSLGSGVLIDESGHIVTNHHVIEGTSKIEVEFRDGTKLPMLGCCRWDESRDVAILLVDHARVKVKPLPLLDALPRKGEHVLTIGAPLRFDFTVSEGNVSAVRKGSELAKIEPSLKAYAADAYWIQTTAPISSGNSGGPLIDMQGRVVGLNTWTMVRGQNMNFAISSLDVLAEFKKLNGEFVPLPNAPAETIAGEGHSGEPVILLPSGTLVHIGAIFLEGVNDFNAMFPPRVPVHVLTFNSGRPWALVSHRQGRFHGCVAALYETGVIATIANYDDAQRHGNLLTWTTTGERSVFAQYARGKLHGILCRFRDDNLSLVQEYKAGQLVSSHLVEGGEIVKNYVTADMPPVLDEDLAKAHADLEERLAGLADNEATFRKSVMRLEQQNRRLVAAARSVNSRSKIQSREDGRRAAFGGAIADLQTRMGMRP